MTLGLVYAVVRRRALICRRDFRRLPVACLEMLTAASVPESDEKIGAEKEDDWQCIEVLTVSKGLYTQYQTRDQPLGMRTQGGHLHNAAHSNSGDVFCVAARAGRGADSLPMLPRLRLRMFGHTNLDVSEAKA
jgi:hypothetical protein